MEFKELRSNRYTIGHARFIGGFLLMCGALLLLHGCATPPLRPVASQDLSAVKPAEEIKNEIKRLPSYPSPPAIPAPPEPQLPLDQRSYSLTFHKATLGEVLSALMKDTEFNLAVESEVDLSRIVTVRAHNVSLQEALDMIVLNGAGYCWNIAGKTLQIKRFMTKEYHFDHLDLSGESQVEIGGDLLASGTESTSVAGKYQVKFKRPDQSSDLWSALAEALQGLKSEEGILRINRNSGVILLIDTPVRVNTMVRFLDAVSASLNRQVFIEAKIVEVILKDEQKTGIDWTKFDIKFTSGSSFLPDVFTLDVNADGRIAKSGRSQFSAVLDFLRTQGDVSVIASPHITAVNRQPAVFTVGSLFPYTDIDGVDRDLETGVVTVGTKIKRALLGVQLGITPQISQDGIVTLHIVPTLTRIQREVELKIPTAGVGAAPVISNPVIDLQELATMVRVRDGQPVVLAGLISKIKKLTDEGLPLLKDLPYLGNLFKRTAASDESAELVILMTPHIKGVR